MNIVSMSDKVSKSKYQIPKNSPTKSEVVEILATEPSKLKKREKQENKLETPEDVVKKMSSVAQTDSEEIEELMAQGYRLNNLGILLKAMLDVKTSKRDDARLEIFKSKVNNGEELTYEDTTYIDEQIVKEIGLGKENE